MTMTTTRGQLTAIPSAAPGVSCRYGTLVDELGVNVVWCRRIENVSKVALCQTTVRVGSNAKQQWVGCIHWRCNGYLLNRSVF